MANSAKKQLSQKRRPYLMAVVLGTALTSAAPVQAFPASQAESFAVADITRYCAACWRNARLSPDCWDDCTQEVFGRLLERVSPEDWSLALKGDGDERREFFRAIDAVKKRSQRARKPVSSTVEGVADHHELRERRLADQRETVEDACREVVSPRQWQILDLSFDGWSVQEIATKLRLPAARVSDEKYKAIRKLRQSLSQSA
jgi:RNA polymerase sigma factor (sigma-70 family)